jgi:iron complex transport system substrate-binding protein
MRIVSLLPAATEIVCLLGLRDSLVGVSHECDFPPKVRRLPVLTRSAFDSDRLSQSEIDVRVREAMSKGEGASAIDADLLASLQPDIVIAQELCDVCAVPQAAVVRAIARLSPTPRLLALHPHSLSDVFDDILRIGEQTGVSDRAAKVVSDLSERLRRVEGRLKADSADDKSPGSTLLGQKNDPRRVAALEWLDPVMASGHWVVEQVKRVGGVDFLGRDGEPSVCVEWRDVVGYAPDVLVLMPCGFDVERTAQDASLLSSRIGWNEIPAVKNGEVWAVNGGAYFNRSGPRLVDGVEILAEILHPEIFPRREKPEDCRRLEI